MFDSNTEDKQIIFDLSVGYIGGIFIYIVLIGYPEYSKQKRVQQNLTQQYDLFKEGCLSVFLTALNASLDCNDRNHLKEIDAFKHYFGESVSNNQGDRWDAVCNGLTEELVHRLIVEMDVLMMEIHYTLTAVDIDKPEVFIFLKESFQILCRYRKSSAEYHDIKELMQFMWQVFTCPNWLVGYIKEEVVAKVIEKI